MAENDFKEFDNTSQSGIVFKGQSFRWREVIVGVCAVILLVLCIVLVILLAVGVGGKSTIDTECKTMNCLQTGGNMALSVDSTKEPCDDFYAYACGGWNTVHHIDPDQTESTTLQNMEYENEEKLRRLLEYKNVRKDDGAFENKLQKHFASCTDTYTKEKLRGTPLIDRVIMPLGNWFVFDDTAVASGLSFNPMFQKLHVDYWSSGFFSYGIYTQKHLFKKRVLSVYASGNAMFYRYYFDGDSNVKYQTAYKQFVRTVAQLLVRDNNMTLTQDIKDRIETFISDIYDIEKRISVIYNNTDATEDPLLPTNFYTLADLQTQTGDGIDFAALFKYMFSRAKWTDANKVSIQHLDYLKQINGMIRGLDTNTKDRKLHNYLMWRAIYSRVQDLSFDYITANRDYYFARTGVAAFLGNWRYCFQVIAPRMRDALSALYVMDHFADANKAKAHGMVKRIKSEITHNLMNIPWMDEAAKQIATKKIPMVIEKLGYRSDMIDMAKMDFLYQNLAIDGKNYFQNILNVNSFIADEWNDWVTKDEDEKEWWLATYQTQVFYHGPWRMLVATAGILQFPIYQHDFPNFLNYGAAGSLLGHNLLHAVDDFGKNYQPNGTEAQWWSADTKKKFDEAQQCINDHFTATVGPYRVNGELKKPTINGSYYASEAIAEIGGVRNSYEAYQILRKETGEELVLPGLNRTEDQLFFISYAQTYCAIRNDAKSYSLALQNQLPEKVKVNKVLQQLDEFSQAFNCPVGAAMKPTEATQCNVF